MWHLGGETAPPGLPPCGAALPPSRGAGEARGCHSSRHCTRPGAKAWLSLAQRANPLPRLLGCSQSQHAHYLPSWLPAGWLPARKGLGWPPCT